MKTVDLRSIDSSKLFLMESRVHSESSIFTDYTSVYKIFEGITFGLSSRKEAKVDYLSKIKEKDALVLPNQKVIFKNSSMRLFLGYRMKYIDGITLFDIQNKLNDFEYFLLLSNISRRVKNIHIENDRFVFGDLNFDNILVNDLLDFFFLDLDGCSIGNIKNERIPMIISEYMGYKNTYLKINRNFDRLTFLLYIFDYIFGRAIFEVSQYEFDQKMEIYGFLKNIRKLFIELNKINREISYIPYPYEFIELKEDELSKVTRLLQKS